MNIVVLSDTHIPGRAKALPDIVQQSLENADHIVHAGDIRCAELLSELESYAPVTAVAGNVDPPALRELLGERKRVTLGGFMFGLVHGYGRHGNTLSRAIAAFEDGGVDCVIFGHSHIPYCGYHNGVLLFNPGSPTDKRRSRYYSFGVIETGDMLSGRIVYFDRAGRKHETGG